MIIILEGPDKVGKTEIAKALARRLKFPYFKFELEGTGFKEQGFFNNLTTYSLPFFVSYLKQTEPDVVIDRFYQSEVMYSQVLGRSYNSAVIDQADADLAKLGDVFLIICLKDEVNEEDEHIDKKYYEALARKYRYEIGLISRIPTLKLDTTDQDLDRELREILDFIG
jgi:hypothetical protein